MVWQFAYIGVVVVVCLISLSQAHRHPPAMRALSALLLLIVLVELSSLMLGQHQISNQFLFHVYTPIEYAFIGWLYADSTRRFNRWIWVSVVGFTLFCLMNALIWQPITTAPSNVYMVEWLLVVGLVLNYLYAIYRTEALIDITRQPLFWISIGNFIYYAGTFFVMALINRIQTKDPVLASQLYLINTFLNVLMYSLWGVGFLCNRTSPT